MSLPKVLQRIEPVVMSHGTGRNLSRVQLARALGYTNPISGRFAALVTCLMQYGLLERAGTNYRCSTLAVAILSSTNAAHRKEAMQQAALHPQVLRTITEHLHGFPDDATIIRLAVTLFHGRITPAQAKTLAAILPPTLTAAGMIEASGEVLHDSGTRSIVQGDQAATAHAVQSWQHSVQAVQAKSVTVDALPHHTNLTKQLGDGRMVSITVPVDLTQEERDNLMALIQYL